MKSWLGKQCCFVRQHRRNMEVSLFVGNDSFFFTGRLLSEQLVSKFHTFLSALTESILKAKKRPSRKGGCTIKKSWKFEWFDEEGESDLAMDLVAWPSRELRMSHQNDLRLSRITTTVDYNLNYPIWVLERRRRNFVILKKYFEISPFSCDLPPSGVEPEYLMSTGIFSPWRKQCSL